MEKLMAQRLRAFMDYLISEERVYNDADFCRKIGKNSSMVSQYSRGGRKITYDFVDAIHRVFPELNMDWLLNEDCTQMISPEGNFAAKGVENMRRQVIFSIEDLPKDKVSIIKELRKQVVELEQKNNEKDKVIQDLVAQNLLLANELLKKTQK